jgi:glycosyltransferase involved in cell wall biosynthesis
MIKEEIMRLKHFLRLGSYPPLLFFGSLMSREQVQGLHERCHCFVLPQRGEGFGIPIAEAMGYGKPTISTRYGGNMEYMTDENSYLINCWETPVYGMIFGNYSGDMEWADPDIMHLRKLMRWVFNNKEEASEKGLEGQQTIQRNYSSETIGRLMHQRLSKIQSMRREKYGYSTSLRNRSTGK